VSALFTKISQLIQRVLRGVMSCFSYSRERTWTYCGPTQVEVGHDELRVGRERPAAPEPLSSDFVQDLPSDPEQYDKVMDGIKEAGELGEELFENGLAYFKGLNKIVKEDRQHKNRRETAQKLRNLKNEEYSKKLHAALLDNQPTVNPGLA